MVSQRQGFDGARDWTLKIGQHRRQVRQLAVMREGAKTQAAPKEEKKSPRTTVRGIKLLRILKAHAY